MHPEKGGSPIAAIVIILAVLVAGVAFFGMDKLRALFSIPETPPITEEGTPDEEVPLVQQYKDLVRVRVPERDQSLVSPLVIEGEARGMWFFEASIPVRLLDADGNDVPLEPGYVMATDDWMTESYVPFRSEHTFTPPETETGTLVLMKDNPSGLPENEDAFLIPVRFR